MTAADYPVTFPYGATDYPYGPSGYAGPYHRGDDRAMPDDTPIVVNGVTIGLSGHTGEVTGAHLHIGRFVGGKDTNPNGQGFNLKQPAIVTQVSSDTNDGKFVAVNDADGVRWVYLHMSDNSKVSVGQVLQGADMDIPDNVVKDLIGALWFVQANANDYANAKNVDPIEWVRKQLDDPRTLEEAKKRNAAVNGDHQVSVDGVPYNKS